MVAKPSHVFDRDREWAGLTRFAANPHRGTLLGVVSGRRRQGKSFLLEALTSATGGLYFPALEETEAVSLRAFAARPVPSTAAGALITGANVRSISVTARSSACLQRSASPMALNTS